VTLAKAASLVAMAVVFPAGCSSSGGTPSAGKANGWTVAGPAANQAVLGSVWAGGADVYAASIYGPTRFVFSSHDHGATWTSVPVGNEQTELTGVAATRSGEVYVVGYTNPFIDVAKTGPLVLKSTDGGATFATLAPDLQGAISAVWADPERGLYVAGSESAGGFFARSTDGGLGWTRTLVQGSSYVSGLWVSAAGDIYAAGGAVFKSTDEGATWTVVATPPTEATAISGSPDGVRIVASGAGLLVVQSVDGGATWQMLSGSAALVGSDAPVLGGVWVADAVSDAYFAAGRYGVLRTVSTGDAAGTPFVSGGDFLPDTPIIYAVTGDAADLWAVGGTYANAMSAIYHKTLVPR
jgi:hypothetical protein